MGSEEFYSDANTVTGKTQIVTLASGEYNPTLDAGVYQTASLGDRLWVDSNHNGQQDDGLTGISGQTVTLIGGGADGLIFNTGDNTSTTTTTGVDGFYNFTGLTPGVQYQVQFAAPAGYVFTGQDIGPDVSDSDANTSTGKTQIVTLASGEYNPTLFFNDSATTEICTLSLHDALPICQQDDGLTGISGQTVTLIG